MNGTFGEGNKRDLEIQDLFERLDDDSSKSLGDRLSANWEKQIRQANLANAKSGSSKKNPVQPSLGRAIWSTFSTYYILVGILAGIEECVTRLVVTNYEVKHSVK